MNQGVYGFFGVSVFAETADLAWTDFAETRFSRQELGPLLELLSHLDLTADFV